MEYKSRVSLEYNAAAQTLFAGLIHFEDRQKVCVQLK